jgi:putative membrane protein
LVAIGALALWQPVALWLAALLPLAAAAALLDWRFHRFALDGDMLFIERGVWSRRLWLVPLANVQAISLSRGPLQRGLGLATLNVDTAGAPVLQGARIIDLRVEIAEALAGRMKPHSSGRKSGTER